MTVRYSCGKVTSREMCMDLNLDGHHLVVYWLNVVIDVVSSILANKLHSPATRVSFVLNLCDSQTISYANIRLVLTG
jgi:hypothetical protein